MVTKTRTHGFAVMMICALCIAMAGILFGSGAAMAEGSETQALTDCGVLHEPEFGGVYIKMTIDDFNSLGFVYGDSVTVSFSNGYTLDDIPYYNGYYVQNGQPLLIAYPGYDYIKAATNNGEDLWTVAGLEDDATSSITLKERGKYADIQQAKDIHYVDDRSQFESDVVFANFRNMQVGDLREGMVFRSASPCDNRHNRASYVDALIADAGVRYIMNLADTDEKLQGYIAKEDFNSPYFLSLYKEGKVHPLAMNMNFGSEIFHGKVVDSFKSLLANDGPYLIHCTEGKDRTGFVCMLVEALCGADYQEIVDDYMITYDNYYGITKETDPKKYNVIVEDNLNPMIYVVVGRDDVDLKSVDLSECASAFLKEAGMSDEEISDLTAKLTK